MSAETVQRVGPGARIAILSDIHGNSIALDAALAAVGTVDAYWMLGDYCAIGPDPSGVLERLLGLENAHFIRGNTDRYVGEDLGPWIEEAAATEDSARRQRGIHTAAGFAWTIGAVAATGRLDWMRKLPLEFRAELPDGTRVLAAHASPGEDDGSGINPTMTDEEVAPLLRGADADLFLFGHVHFSQDRVVDGVRLVNPGSVSNQLPPDLRAKFVILEAGQDDYELTNGQVDYDHKQVIAEAARVGQPAAGYIARYMRGEVIPSWMEAQ